MKKLFQASAILFFLFSGVCKSFGQTDSVQTYVKDTTPIEELDYHLSQQEFMDYYGTDDTAKAVINMFFRKRGEDILDYGVVPLLTLAGYVVADLSTVSSSVFLNSLAELAPVGAIFASAGTIYLIYRYAQRGIYNRRRLLNTLVLRERGTKIPLPIILKLRAMDFD